MKPRYLQTDSAGRDRWMISYLDVLTILLIFFIAVAAKGLEAAKSVEAPKSIKIVLPDPPPAKAEVDRRSLEEKLQTSGLSWRAEPQGVAITLPQAVLFAAAKAQVSSGALPVVEKIADVLGGIPNKISLAGYADPVPIHNHRFRNNWELAAARSLQLLNIFTIRYGIAESRFSISSYGSNDPRNPNDTPDGRAGNRRVEILILDETP